MSLQNILIDAVKKHFDDDDDDLNPAASHAAKNSSSSSAADPSLFTQALSFIKERKASAASEDIDEGRVIQSHQSLYSGSSDKMDSGSVGAGAALEALKMFNSGSGEETGGGKDKNAFIGLAMAQAARMWDEKSGKGEASGDKQSAVNSAAEMAFKMYMKSKMSGSEGTGGPSGLMSLASKFLK